MNPPLSLRQQAQSLKTRELGKISSELGVAYNKGLQWTLPFFKKPVNVVELTDESVLPARRDYYIKEEERFQPLTFMPGFVEGLVQTYGLSLSRDTIEDYIRFYLAFTRGQAGRVLPIDMIDELPLREELTLITRRKLQGLITPLVVEDASHATGCFLIKDKLLKTRVTVDAKGTLALEAQGLLADTLPVSDSLLEP